MNTLILTRMIRQTTWACLVAIAVQAGVASAQPAPVPGRNVNLVSGPAELNLAVSPPIVRGDLLLKQQNEGSCAMSSRNPKNILCGGNDYRLVDLPGVDPNSVTRDAWGGVYQSANGGDTWESTVHPGSFLDPAPSVLKNYRAMADVTVRGGAAGLAYYSALAFNAANNSSIIFVSTWLDLNNKEDERMSFKMVRPVLVVDSGPVYQFLDKPWTFVSAPENDATCQIAVPRPDGTVLTQTIPDSPLYIGYTIFVGNQPNQNQIRTKTMIAKVTNCGARVSQPVKVSEGQAINQGFAIAKSLEHGSNRLVGVWRRFDNGRQTNAILAAVSNNGGATWSKPIVVAAPICPFEQGSTATSARVNTFPAITADETGRFYVAWSDRGKGAGGACLTGARSRIVVSSSANGTKWTSPAVVDSGVNDAHQITPSLTYGGGTLHLLWKDLRESASSYFDAYVNEWPLLMASAGTPPPPPAPPVPGPPVRHHTVDVWSRMASPIGESPSWGPSVRVSQYKFGVSPGEAEPSQKQWNIINLRLFAKNTKVFDSDYLDSTTPPLLPPDAKTGRTRWTYDLGQGGDPVFFGVWTDNRDVRKHAAHKDPTGTVPLPYTPPGGGGTSIYDPTQQRPLCTPVTGDYTGTMNQNLYGARIDRGLFAYSPGNNKPVTDFPRAFVVIVRNDSDLPKTFELSIPAAYQPTGGTASFTEIPPFSFALLVQVPARSSASRTVFIVPDDDDTTTIDSKTTVRVDVTEVGSGATLDASVYINPDPTAPEIEAPEIEAPEIEAVELYTPEIEAASISTILNSSVPSPEIEAPEIEAPEIEAPEIEAPEIEAPEIEAPEIEANAITDITWPIQNTGNTVAGYAVRPTVAGGPGGFDFQLIISRVVLIATASNCNPAQATTSKVAVNIVDANALVDPDAVISPEDLKNATIWIAPGERVLATLRVRGDTAFNPVTHPTVVTVEQQAIDTEDYREGATEPPIFTAGSVPLAIVTSALPGGDVGEPYTASLLASGGVPPYVWTLVSGSLPPGLALNPSGFITGEPTSAGSYTFTLGVHDSKLPSYTSLARTYTIDVIPKVLSFQVQPTDVTGGQAISPAVQVRAVDGNGASLPGIAISMALGANPGGGALAGTTVVVTNSDGIASFGNLSIDRGSAGYTLVASSPGAGNVASQPFHVIGFSTTGSTVATRLAHTATVLVGGKVLLTGGSPGGVPTSTAELYDPATNTFSSSCPGGSGTLPALLSPRASHTATLLASGKVLLVGGYDTSSSTATNTAEIFDPVLCTFSPTTANMGVARTRHTATLLASGKVLIAGGQGTGILSSAEIFDPATGTFAATGNSLSVPRVFHTATLLPTGKVLIVGGEETGVVVHQTGELFDPAAGTFSTLANSLATPRRSHTATLLASGTVLIAGGMNDSATLSSAEVYDPVLGTFSGAGSMNSARRSHAATLLSNDEVLIAGGYDGNSSLSSAELYSASTGFTPTGSLSATNVSPEATLLPSGKVLTTGWGAGGELFHPLLPPGAPLPVTERPVAVFGVPGGQLVRVFRNSTDFTAALGGASTETQNFDSFNVGDPISTVISGVLNVASPFGSLEVFGAKDLFGFDASTRLSGLGRYELTFVASRNAIGFDVTAQDPATRPVRVVVETSAGNVSFLLSNPTNSENNPTFVGIITRVPIQKVIVYEGFELGGGNEEVALDNFRVALLSIFP